jgi:hypothetical protein
VVHVGTCMYYTWIVGALLQTRPPKTLVIYLRSYLYSPLVVKVKIFETAQALSFRTPRALNGFVVRPQVSICFVSKTFISKYVAGKHSKVFSCTSLCTF